MAAWLDITNVDVRRAPQIHSWGYGGATYRLKGTDDWTATVNQKAQGGGPQVLSGVKTTAVTITDSNGDVIAGPAICIDVQKILDEDTGAPAEYVYSLGANGALVTDDTGGATSGAYTSAGSSVDWT